MAMGMSAQGMASGAAQAMGGGQSMSMTGGAQSAMSMIQSKTTNRWSKLGAVSKMTKMGVFFNL